MSLPYLYQTQTIQPKTLCLHRRLFQPPLPHQKLKKTHDRLYSKFKCLQPQQQPPSSRMPPTVAKFLRAELNGILLATKAIQSNQTSTYIFTNNLDNICLINIHIWQPSSQQHRPNKLPITIIIHQIYWVIQKNSHTQSTCSHQHSQ